MADLGIYEVPHRNHKTTVKLSEEEAKALYGDAAKKVGDAKKAEPQPVARPPWDTGEVRDPADDSSTEAGTADGEKDSNLVTSRHARGEDEKKAPAPRNKSRDADNK